MSGDYVIALDQGTQSTRAILFNDRGDPICMHQVTHEQIRPDFGWEEHNPIEILDCAKTCINECAAEAGEKHGITSAQIKALGITNQRETTIVWDRNTGVPLYNAIVWHDTRTHSTCDALREAHDTERIRRICGLPISTYFSGVKLRWMMDNVPSVAAGIANGSALFGTIDTWLVWNLSEEKRHVTDVTNAGRTMLMNIETLEWDEELLSVIGVGREILPEIRSCSEVYGHLGDTSLKGIPIAGLIGDQQAALVGQSCFEIGQSKNTYGTGGFLIVNTGTSPKFSKNGLLTTPAYKMGEEACVYSLEGSIATAGSAVTWLRDGMEMIGSAGEIEGLAGSVADSGDVYCVPAFSGLLAPWWREDARGTVVGITHKTTKAHVARAVLEGIALQVEAVVQAASEDMGSPIRELRADGGASVNNLLLQTQADVMGCAVVRPRVVETTALGAGFAAGHAVGLFQSVEAFTRHWELDRQFDPAISAAQRAAKLARWRTAVDKSLGWVEGADAPRAAPREWAAWVPSRDALAGMAIGAGVGALLAVAACRLRK